jgi:Protein of unknown function (DUF1769)
MKFAYDHDADTTPTAGPHVPLGIPFAFESDLFHGKILIRLRTCKSQDPVAHDAYFRGRQRVMQLVLQGKFRRAINGGDLYCGGVFPRALRWPPPPFFQKLLNSLFHRIAPGAIVDLNGDQPRVLSLLIGAAQTIHMAATEQEVPDITAVDLPDNMHEKYSGCLDWKCFKTIADRRRKLSLPTHARQLDFDTDHVYTIQSYDNHIDYGSFTVKLPVVGRFDLTRVMGPQPMNLSIGTFAESKRVATLLDLDVWHEKIYNEKEDGNNAL